MIIFQPNMWLLAFLSDGVRSLSGKGNFPSYPADPIDTCTFMAILPTHTNETALGEAIAWGDAAVTGWSHSAYPPFHMCLLLRCIPATCGAVFL